MKVANKLVNTFAALSFGSAAAMATTSAVYAADLPRGYQHKADDFVQQPENQCDETLRHMALRAKEARATATEGDSFFGQLPKFFTTTDDGVSVEISHVHGRDSSGQYGCTSGQFVKLYKNENTKSAMDHVDALAGAVSTVIVGPMRITNMLSGGTQIQSPTINGSTAMTGPVTTGAVNVKTGAVTANGGAGGNATGGNANASAAAAAKAEATAKATATATEKVREDWKKAHNGDVTGCGCGETNSGRPSHNGGSGGGKQSYNGPNN